MLCNAHHFNSFCFVPIHPPAPPQVVIKRPYFHVKPLDDTQLANWHKYLDYTEKEGDTARVRIGWGGSGGGTERL